MSRSPELPTTTNLKPELLAPAGGRAQLEAAVWSGADAVYFGLDVGLNARVRATAFNVDDLPATMEYLRERGVRGYLTLNTLVFDEELQQAEQLVRRAAEAGVDALIVQDPGLVRLAASVAPNLPLHGSTQMSVADAAGVAFAEQLGVRRVVIGRELSIDDIARVVSDSRLEIETFVHGALCVSYSGQCFSSEAWGGRSANRGQCAQACRLPYGLLVDGELRELGDFHYLLSPQDLMALELLPRLVRAGVSCFKIEGRLKGPEYVLSTVTAYREALDSIWNELQGGREVPESLPLPTDRRRRLAQAFSRGQGADHDGLSPGFLEGPRHQSLVIGRNPRHRGLFIGEVTRVTERGVTTRLQGPVKRGDGLVFDHGRAEERETGGNLHHVIDRHGDSLCDETDQGEVQLLFGPNFALERIRPGHRIWRTRDSARDGGTRLDPGLAARQVPVDIRVRGNIGQSLVIELEDTDGNRVSASTQSPLQVATGNPLDLTKVGKAIGSLGDTPFVIRELSFLPDNDAQPLFMPLSAIKTARREGVAALLARRRAHQRARDLAPQTVLHRLLPQHVDVPTASTPGLSLLCRTKAQVDAALAIEGIDEIVVDFLEVHGLKDACIQVRAAGRRLIVAAPRIFKPGEERLWRYYCRLSPDALLVRSAGLLWELQQIGGSGTLLDDGETRIPSLHGDFSLNAANLISTRFLLDCGLQRLTLTHDLNGAQISALTRALPVEQRRRIEVIAHHHLPIFHTEYCVFARFLSKGNSYRDCGRPCEKHTVHLRDSSGGDHLVQADIGCRNTVFNAAAQSAGPLLNEFTEAGLEHYRIELVDEPASQVAVIVGAYQRCMAGVLSAADLQTRLSDITDANSNAGGIGLGSLAIRVEPPRSRLKKPTSR